MKKTFIYISFFSFILFSFQINSVISQVIDVKGKIKDKSIQRADEKTDQTIDKGLDKVEEGVGNLFKKKEKKSKDNNSDNNENNQTSDNTENNTNDNSNNNSQIVPQNNTIVKDDKPKQESIKLYSKFDFIPGTKILFFDDFSQDNLNEYPLNWITNGRGEVLTFDKYPGVKWFRMNTEGTNATLKFFPFEENTTIEFDMIAHVGDNLENSLSDIVVQFYQETEENKETVGEYVPGTGGFKMLINSTTFDFGSWENQSYKQTTLSATSNEVMDNKNEKIHISIWVQKRRVRFYVNQYKVMDAPMLVPTGIVPNRIAFWSSSYNDQFSFLLTNLKIAVGSPDTRNKIITDGKYVTNAIKFDVGSDKLKPESYAVIKEIATVIKENATLKLKIVGFTDSDGDDATNLSLSKKRSISVKNALVTEFGIDASKLETDGKGELEPIAPNNTPEGKATNRRVEFIKL